MPVCIPGTTNLGVGMSKQQQCSRINSEMCQFQTWLISRLVFHGISISWLDLAGSFLQQPDPQATQTREAWPAGCSDTGSDTAASFPELLPRAGIGKQAWSAICGMFASHVGNQEDPRRTPRPVYCGKTSKNRSCFWGSAFVHLAGFLKRALTPWNCYHYGYEQVSERKLLILNPHKGVLRMEWKSCFQI